MSRRRRPVLFVAPAHDRVRVHCLMSTHRHRPLLGIFMLFDAWDEDDLDGRAPRGWYLWNASGPAPAADDPARYKRWARPLVIYDVEHYYLECPCGERALLPADGLARVLDALRTEAVSSISLGSLAGKVLHQ